MVNTNANIDILQIYKSRKIVLELMQKQGFEISDYNNFSITEISLMNQNKQLDMLLETKTDIKKKIYISYYLEKSLKPSNISEIIEDLFVLTETLTKNDILYIIIKDEINETLTNELKHIWEKDGIFIVVENIKRLQFNILKHILVPEHIIIEQHDVDELMKIYNIKNVNQFPNISRFDPVARAICIRPGQVCKIIRPSKTSIESIYYRFCI